MAIITPRHIGSGTAFFIVGGLFLAIDIFAVLTQSMSEPRAVMLGGGMITVAGIIGGVIIALGFSVRLFGMVEARLIEIEQAIIAMRETTPPPSKPRAPSPMPPPSTAP
jgi:hypothetical protein